MPIQLFHGSRGGIIGDIEPISRPYCDFGAGFYMGTNPDQAKTLVYNDSSPVFYELSFNISQIDSNKILQLEGMDWAYFVLYCRGKLEEIKNSQLYAKCKSQELNKDLIIGPIADDAMNDTMKRFIDNTITDKAFFECIRALNYGTQYVCKSKLACSCVEIIEEKPIKGQELQIADALAKKRRTEGVVAAREIQALYRREGKFLEEILNEESRKLAVQKGLER